MNKRISLTGLILLLCIMIGACGGSGTQNVTTTAAETTAADSTAQTTEESTEGPEPAQTASLDGKKVIFIGNSYIYFGGVVIYGDARSNDSGWFWKICRENGENVTVTDCTYGGHYLHDFTEAGCKTGNCSGGKGSDLLRDLDLTSYDYVFMSEDAVDNADFVQDVQAIVKRFNNPDTVFVYLCHTDNYCKKQTKITGNLSTLQDLGIYIVDWGHLCYDVIMRKTTVEGATQKYDFSSFINNKSDDSYHPNPLGGYIQALSAYCAVTSKSAVGQSYEGRTKILYGPGNIKYADYTAKYSNQAGLLNNFTAIFDSEADMLGLQKLIDKYLADWGLGTGTVPPALRTE